MTRITAKLCADAAILCSAAASAEHHWEAPSYLSAEHWMVRELECDPEAGDLADAAHEEAMERLRVPPPFASHMSSTWAEAEALLLGDEWTPEGWR